MTEISYDLELLKKTGGDRSFQYACKNGHSKLAEMLEQNSADFSIDLDAKDKDGYTALHLACISGCSKVQP